MTDTMQMLNQIPDLDLRVAALEAAMAKTDSTLAVMARITAALSNEVGTTSAMMNLISIATGANAMKAALTADEIKPIDLSADGDLLEQLSNLQEIDPRSAPERINIQLAVSTTDLASAYIRLARATASIHRALTTSAEYADDTAEGYAGVIEDTIESLRELLRDAQGTLANIALAGVMPLYPESTLSTAVDELTTEIESEGAEEADTGDADEETEIETAN